MNGALFHLATDDVLDDVLDEFLAGFRGDYSCPDFDLGYPRINLVALGLRCEIAAHDIAYFLMVGGGGVS